MFVISVWGNGFYLNLTVVLIAYSMANGRESEVTYGKDRWAVTWLIQVGVLL